MTTSVSWWKQPCTKPTVLLFVALLGLVLISKWMATTEPKYQKSLLKRIQRLVQQASRWHSTAQQDGDALVRLIHSNYAMAYSTCARSLVSESALDSISGLRWTTLVDRLEQDQRNAVQAVVQKCPTLKPQGTYHIGIAWT